MKKIFLAAFLFTTAFCHEMVEDRSGLKIETPEFANRQQKKIRLDNGLEIFLISDPESKQSGAALAVGVGSWDDPADRPGMAHFVEHLLFLGTEKYPEEEEYARYLGEYGGNRNAFTMADRTVYMFSINNEGFSEALDRFGQFFISPLFNPSGVDRECKAIHQEFCKDLPLDPWRVHYVKKELANLQHPFHQFCIGNKDTLDQISQDELKEWYHRHYSSHLMHLVVYSSKDLNTLEAEVIPLFSQVKRTGHSLQPCPDTILSPKNFSQLIAISPLQDIQILELSWELPRFFGTDRQTHADKLVSHVLGHEGSTSLIAQLKRENLAESVSAGTSRAGKDQCFFTLSLKLTEKGIQEYETVIQRCFEAIATLNKSGIPRYIFDEVTEIEELKYRFQPREEVFDTVTELAYRLVDEPLETFPRESLLPTAYSPEKILEFLGNLTPYTCQFTLVAPPHLTHFLPTSREKWMEVEYSLIAITSKKLENWAHAKPHFNISVPRPNPFLPESISLEEAIPEKSLFPKPSVTLDSPYGKMYLCQDSRFLIPEISWTFTIHTPEITAADPKSQALADLFCLALNESLNSIAYEAKIAGLKYSLESSHSGLELQVIGYSDKADTFLKTLLSSMKQSMVTQDQFMLYSQQLMRQYVNTANKSPLNQGRELLSEILYKKYAGFNQRSDALKQISYLDFQNFCLKLFQMTYIEGMLYGNGPSTRVWDIFKQNLVNQPFSPEEHFRKELAAFPDDGHPSYFVLKSQHPANALILTTDCGEFTFKRRAAQEILSKGLEDPFFNELRTKQQTAYLVANWAQELERHLYCFFAIQSSSHDTRDLLSRFELFLETSMQHLQENVIPKKRFETIQTALITKLEHPAENLPKMGALLHQLAFDYDGDFNWLEKRKEALKSLSYEEFLQYAQEFLGKENPRRLALFVNGTLPSNERFSYKKATTLEKVKEAIFYKPRSISQTQSSQLIP